jgi:hypothetical protein
MVNYNIIRILKGYVGYSSWTDVPTKQRELVTGTTTKM